MEYSPEIKDPTAEQAAAACERIAVWKKALADDEKTVKNFARSNGGFSHLNVHVWETATIYPEMPQAQWVAKAALELFGDDPAIIEEILRSAIDKIDNRSLKGWCKSLNGWDHIAAEMAKLDPSGNQGCEDVIGSYSLDIRTSAPDLSKVVLKEPNSAP